MIEIVQLDDIDKRILFELERNARLADVKLAKIVKKSKDAVRYRIKTLEKTGVITGYKTWIDMAKLGFKSATLYLNLLYIPSKKEKMIEFIKNDPKTYWIGVAEGAWNIGVSYFVKSNEELFQLKHTLISKFRDIILDVKMTYLVSVSVHEKNFLVDETTKLTSFTETIDNVDLDGMSKKILANLYWNATENIATLADKLDTTIDIVRNRIKNLENEGIIIRYSAVIDYQKIGYEFHKAFVYLKQCDSEFLKKLHAYVAQSKVIINLVKQIAPWDFELVLFTRNFAEYDEALGHFTQTFATQVQKIESATMAVDIIFPCSKLPF
ncbi:Lrp/AsnC family transcriptional regulator [Candidatus Pacearchaeota archaeon]|nr:Lrp/AsnC family transcriptional regulator [Candidatus Pacearchaeota archaeon]